jgi:hypothetical protein
MIVSAGEQRDAGSPNIHIISQVTYRRRRLPTPPVPGD